MPSNDEVPELPPGMKDVKIGSPFQPSVIETVKSLGSKKVFVLCNNSSRKHLEGDGKLIELLKSDGILACPLNSSVGMGGGEEGLLQACNEAYESDADCIITFGGGAIQDAGKLIRLWLSTKPTSTEPQKASVAGIQAAQNRNPMPELPPQIACPNSFAMAEATHVAGIQTTAKTKSGAAHPSLMPTYVIYDPALSKVPDWVRFGTALRGVEHAVGATCHPKANDEIRARALQGLEIIYKNIQLLLEDPESEEAQSGLYLGGWKAIRALNTGCYPALGHLLENHYSARYDVHQGSCSGILCARILNHHREESAAYQRMISVALGEDENSDSIEPAPRLVAKLAKELPGVATTHEEVGVTDEMLNEFAEWEFQNHIDRVNLLSPKMFESSEDIFKMLNFPLDQL